METETIWVPPNVTQFVSMDSERRCLVGPQIPPGFFFLEGGGCFWRECLLEMKNPRILVVGKWSQFEERDVFVDQDKYVYLL